MQLALFHNNNFVIIIPFSFSIFFLSSFIFFKLSSSIFHSWKYHGVKKKKRVGKNKEAFFFFFLKAFSDDRNFMKIKKIAEITCCIVKQKNEIKFLRLACFSCVFSVERIRYCKLCITLDLYKKKLELLLERFFGLSGF